MLNKNKTPFSLFSGVNVFSCFPVSSLHIPPFINTSFWVGEKMSTWFLCALCMYLSFSSNTNLLNEFITEWLWGSHQVFILIYVLFCFFALWLLHPAGLSCLLSVRARGTWSTALCATARCPCSSSSPWWTGRCSSVRHATTRSSTTSPATFKVRFESTKSVQLQSLIFTTSWSLLLDETPIKHFNLAG